MSRSPVSAVPAAVHEEVEQGAQEQQRPGHEAQRMRTMPGQAEPGDERERGGSHAEDHPAMAPVRPLMSVRHGTSLSSVGLPPDAPQRENLGRPRDPGARSDPPARWQGRFPGAR